MDDCTHTHTKYLLDLVQAVSAVWVAQGCALPRRGRVSSWCSWWRPAKHGASLHIAIATTLPAQPADPPTGVQQRPHLASDGIIERSELFVNSAQFRDVTVQMSIVFMNAFNAIKSVHRILISVLGDPWTYGVLCKRRPSDSLVWEAASALLLQIQTGTYNNHGHVLLISVNFIRQPINKSDHSTNYQFIHIFSQDVF